MDLKAKIKKPSQNLKVHKDQAKNLKMERSSLSVASTSTQISGVELAEQQDRPGVSKRNTSSVVIKETMPLTSLQATLDISIAEATKLAEFQGMKFCKVNGQRCYGPLKTYNGPEPQKRCEVFVGKIPRDIFERELVPIFERIGPIYELRIMTDFSGTNKGYCFVRYYNTDNANKCIKELNGHKIKNQRICVAESVDNCRIYIGGIPVNATKEQMLLEVMRESEGVSHIIVPPSFPRGAYFFVEYVNHRSAVSARRKFISENSRLFGCHPIVDWAKPASSYRSNNSCMSSNNVPEQPYELNRWVGQPPMMNTYQAPRQYFHSRPRNSLNDGIFQPRPLMEVLSPIEVTIPFQFTTPAQPPPLAGQPAYAPQTTPLAMSPDGSPKQKTRANSPLQFNTFGIPNAGQFNYPPPQQPQYSRLNINCQEFWPANYKFNYPGQIESEQFGGTQFYNHNNN